jgi:molecular chaperone GrpE
VSKEETKRRDDAENADPNEAQNPEAVAAADDQKPAGDDAHTTLFLEQALAGAQKRAQEYMESWQRERADFANYKKRAERELRESQDYARINTLMTLLPVIDDFELAMSNLPEDLKNQPWLDGVSAIQRKFWKILDEHGVHIIDPVGEVFDPSRHEAIGVDSETEAESGHVTVTLQKGYASGDRVLRPALVRVAQ